MTTEARIAVAAVALVVLGATAAPADSLQTPGARTGPEAAAVSQLPQRPYLPLFVDVLPDDPSTAPPVRPPGPSPASPHPTIRTLPRDIAGDFLHLPSMSTLRAATVGSGIAVAAHQIDTDVNRHLAGADDLFVSGKVIGLAPVHVGVGVLVYTVGHETDRPRVAHTGLDLLRAQAVAGVLTMGLKVAVRRERPNHGGNLSFPSGHVSASFATASVLARHFGWRAGVPTYLLASYVAASRLHENAHYLSDVVGGATVGYIAGRTVTRHGRNIFTMVPILGRDGGGLIVVRTW